jgi:hypothetical protein
MGKIVTLFRRSDFDPDTIELLERAYDKARRSLHDKGQPPIVEEVIAARILAAVKTGERDPDKLCELALAALGSKAVFER